MIKPSRYWLFLGLFIAIEAVLYVWVDAPIALWARTVRETHPAIKELFATLTDFGLGKWYAWSSGSLFLIAALLFLKAPLAETAHERAKQIALKSGFFFFATSGAGLASNVIKFFVGRARPKMLIESNVYGFDPLIYKYLWNSFPSGHTTTIFAVAASLAFLFPKARAALYAFALAVGLSRVMVGAHYPSDVVGGMLVGLVFTRFSIFLLHRTKGIM